MKIYSSKNNVYDAVDAVVKYGIAAIEGTKKPAVSYSKQVIKCLEPYSDIVPMQGYQNVPNCGYIYYVYDGNRFSFGDKELIELVFQIDKKNPIHV